MVDPNLQNNYNQAKNIGSQFLSAFFTPGCNISSFYGNDSILTVETDVFFGQQQIMEKLGSINLAFNPNNYEVQPSNNGLVMYVSGQCQIQGEQNRLPFSRVIFLAAQNGSYYVKNDILKISLA